MKKYQVTVSWLQYATIQIEAESPRAAWEAVNKMDIKEIKSHGDEFKDCSEQIDEVYDLEKAEIVPEAEFAGKEHEILTLDDLCKAVASGKQDIDLEDFAQRLNLPEKWDWSDVEYAMKNEGLALEVVIDKIRAGLR